MFNFATRFVVLDSSSGRLCPELLPASTLPSVARFYRSMEAGEISDVSTMPAQATQHTSRHKSGNTNVVVSAPTEPVAGSVAQYWETTTAGRVWFDLCSEQRGVGYLSSTSDGRQYELKPTMLNVCAAARVLLGADSAAVPSRDFWKLKDLEGFWNHHVSNLSQHSEHCPIRPILTAESTLRFRAPFSDTETINRELGSIEFVGGRSAIDIELESAHQLATVKHRLCVDPTKRLWGAQTKALYVDCVSQLLPSADLRSIVCSAVLGDELLASLLKGVRGAVSPENDLFLPSKQRDLRIFRALVAAKWGEERRHTSSNSDAENEGATLSVTDASLTTADAKRQVESSVLTSTQALELVSYCQDVTLATRLVKWMLHEAPSQLTADAIARLLLLHFRTEIRSAPAFHAMIGSVFGHQNERGTMMCRVLSIGTDLCPSKANFGFFDRSDPLDFKSKLKIALFYAKYKTKR